MNYFPGNPIEDTLAFLEKYDVPVSPVPDIEYDGQLKHGITHLREELSEIELAAREEDYIGVADGLIDLAYVAFNICHRIGLPTQEIWDAVHKANMNGKRKVKDVSESKRNNPNDVIKTADFVPPNDDISAALQEAFEVGSGIRI